MKDFLISNWTSIIATLSFFLSVGLAIDRILQSRQRLKLNRIRTYFAGHKSLYLLITITNKSNVPIAIVNAEVGNVKVYRAQHYFMRSNTDECKNVLTSLFPIQLNAHETVDLIMEFVSETNWIKGPNNLKLITSKKPISEDLNLLNLEIPKEQVLKEVPTRYK